MIKKFTVVLTAFAMLAIVAFTGCQRQEGQAPERSAPTTTPASPQGQ